MLSEKQKTLETSIFSYVQNVFYTVQTDFTFWIASILSFANAFNLDKHEILSFGKSSTKNINILQENCIHYHMSLLKAPCGVVKFSKGGRGLKKGKADLEFSADSNDITTSPWFLCKWDNVAIHTGLINHFLSYALPGKVIKFDLWGFTMVEGLPRKTESRTWKAEYECQVWKFILFFLDSID